MTKSIRPAKFQAQFEEIESLTEALRLKQLGDEQATLALRRIFEIMNWPDGSLVQPAQRA